MNNISAIFKRQLKDTIKNKAILIQFLMFPFMTLIMENTIKLENMPENFFAELFAVMYVGMAPLIAMSSIIAEEKEKNTLRVLMMADVKPLQYMSGTGGYVWLLCIIGSLIIGASAGYCADAFIGFMLIMSIGHLISIFIGAAIGVASQNQMTATSVAMPMVMVFAFLPMIAMFNDVVEKIARFSYTQQIKLFLDLPVGDIISAEGAIILLCSLAAAVTVFAAVYKKNGLE